MISREVLTKHAELLGIDASQLLEGVEEYQLVSKNDLEIVIQENKEHKKKLEDFLRSAHTLGQMIDFEKAPLKSMMTIKKMFSNPEKFKEELAPILSLFNKKQDAGNS